MNFMQNEKKSNDAHDISRNLVVILTFFGKVNSR